MAINKDVLDQTLRVFHRILPGPGPELFDLAAKIRRSQSDVDAQVSEALESIQRTSTLVAQLEESLKERAAKLKELQLQHDHLSQLTSIEAEQAAALLRQVEETVGKHRTKEHVIGFGLHILAGLVLFVLGVTFSDWAKATLSGLGRWVTGLFGGWSHEV